MHQEGLPLFRGCKVRRMPHPTTGLPMIHSGWAAQWDVHGMPHTTLPRSQTFSQGRQICHEVWNARTLGKEGGGCKAGTWGEHTEDMNHQVHIQHAPSICIPCTIRYHCYPEALHNLYKHTENTIGLRASNPPP